MPSDFFCLLISLIQTSFIPKVALDSTLCDVSHARSLETRVKSRKIVINVILRNSHVIR